MNWVLVAISFLIVAFGQPASVRGFGVLAAGFGFALFWKAMLGFKSGRDRFFLSLIWFSLVQGVQLSWMATTDYMGPLILLVYLFLILGMGAQFGLLSFLISEGISWHRALAVAGTWVILEWLRLFFLCGFTWNPVGLALADSSYSIQFASIWGIFGLSFWVILVNLAGLNAIINQSKQKIICWASLAFLPYCFGLLQQTFVERFVPVSGHLNAVLIQTALFPEQKEEQYAHPSFIPPMAQWERIINLIDKDKEIDLIVLPEAALPMGAHQLGYDYSEVKPYFSSDALPPLRNYYADFWRGKWKVTNAFLSQALANQFNAHVIIGLDDIDKTGQYNAAFHFRPKNLPYERYEKRVLAPIAEYVPLRQWRRFSKFVATQFGIYSSFNPGKEAKIFNAKYPVGVSICLEETFSNLIRELRLKGAEFFVNLTNDIYFPKSKLPRQHFDHGRIRAAENGVPLLRACNTGVTGGVDCFGRPLAVLPVSERDSSALYLSIPIRSYSTLYTWWGDAAIIGISSISLLSYFWIRKKKLP